jgi:predicted Zn-dependent protease
VLTAAHLATRQSTTKVIANALLKYVDAGIAMNPAPKPDEEPATKPNNNAAPDAIRTPQPDPKIRETASNLSWKSAKYRLLIALDRPQELERDMQTWITRDRQTGPWRLSLARLLAEQGRLDEAVRLYKAVEQADELKPTEYRSLSEWYLAMDNRDAYETAKFKYYSTMPEGSLNQLLNQQVRRYQATDGTAPATLDTEILLMVRALLEKSAYPANYLHQVRSLYATTKDFRLFRSVPIAALGQTAGHTYNIVSNCQYAFSAVMEEATVDELVQLLRSTRDAAKSDVDKRALDLLEVVAERRAVELQNQAGPHVKPALAALKRAFEHRWAAGEHMMMMNFLSNLGRMPQQELASEQRRQMKQLYDWSKAGTFERLQMASLYSGVLWNYSQQADAFLVLESAIDEYDKANNSKWPSQGNGILESYFTKLQQKGRDAKVEAIILDHLSRPRNKGQITFFDNRLDKLYYDALVDGAQVSLGKGQVLYKAYLARLLKRLDTADDNVSQQLVTKLLEILKHARRLKWADAHADFRSFAYKRIPELLKRATNNYRSILRDVGNQVKEFFGATEAIRYMLDRIDKDPVRFRYRNDDAWNNHASSLAGWLYHIIHVEKRKLPKDLDKRLLKFALAELRRDLLSHQQHGRHFYGNNYGYFWEAHRPDFLRATEAVLKEYNNTGDSVTYIAAYLYQINEHKRCIEIMFEAHRKGLLNDGQIHTLVAYLHAQKLYAESVPLLEGLMKRGPDNLGYRTTLMFAYFKLERKQQMMDLLKETDEHFHKENRWTESVMAHLAGSCSTCELWEQSATYYSNAIMQRRRTNPMAASGDATLSSYYSAQSETFLRLGQTKQAVDAAASGIVCWGRNHANRGAAVNRLVSIFNRVEDRDDYATYLDEEAERTQQDRPIVRKALGMAYQRKGEHTKAAAQLRIAVELQPNDAAIHKALIGCYDNLKDQPAAIAATLAFLQLDRRNVEAYAQLGERLKDDAKQQERARTGMVEMKPNEADSHTLLAEIRQRQDRWNAAIHHWEHVVRIRSLEPTGLYKLIAAQIHAKKLAAAKRNIKKLEETKWPQRFGTMRSRVNRFKRDLKIAQ